MIELLDTYHQLPGSFYQRATAEHFPKKELLIFNRELAEELSLGQLTKKEKEKEKEKREEEREEEEENQLAQIFSGERILPGSKPLAQAYAGHQYAHFVPCLGDGRAILLGEVLDKKQRLFDLQLKGAGRTGYSRVGTDGRAPLSAVLREYLISQAMYYLKVPTTRSLAVVRTGEILERGAAKLVGGILTRVASSHIRVGTFQYFAARGEISNVKILLDYAIKRHYPELLSLEKELSYSQKVLLFLEKVIDRQSALMANWLSCGFVHGVMNTDNMTISGETIDYGPCAFLEQFDFEGCFSSIDYYGRYAYFQQPPIAAWNVNKLAECFFSLFEREAELKKLEVLLNSFQSRFEKEFKRHFSQKLGGIKNSKLIEQWLTYLQRAKKDFTLSFYNLSEVLAGKEQFFLGQERELFESFKKDWLLALKETGLSLELIIKRLKNKNPLYIPRNHLVEEALRKADQGDLSPVKELEQVLKRPFEEQANKEIYAKPAQKDEQVLVTYCGT